ncbi:uncharacterized protein LOC135392045 isoform X2 [Ornithodoros turicata]|uniref:uncharacterized protein LOC135392045 isoform X2 n=1 Tax=Ornithodoros turicata TaxID=34597 RepID=UPI003139AA7E
MLPSQIIPLTEGKPVRVVNAVAGCYPDDEIVVEASETNLVGSPLLAVRPRSGRLSCGSCWVYLGSVLGLVCAIGGIAITTYILASPSVKDIHGFVLGAHGEATTTTECLHKLQLSHKTASLTDLTTRRSSRRRPLVHATADEMMHGGSERDSGDEIGGPRPMPVRSGGLGTRRRLVLWGNETYTTTITTKRPTEKFRHLGAVEVHEVQPSEHVVNNGTINTTDESVVANETAATLPVSRPSPILLMGPQAPPVAGSFLRPLVCVVSANSNLPPLTECTHLILSDHVLDLLRRVVRPAAPARNSDAVATPFGSRLRNIRSQSPSLKILAGLRALEVESLYLRQWGNGSSLAAHVNLLYEWLRRVRLDGLAILGVSVGRHTVQLYAEFFRKLRALFREDFLIAFGFLHREDHAHDFFRTEDALKTFLGLCDLVVIESHDARPRPCRSFIVNPLGPYRGAVADVTVRSSLQKLRRLGPLSPNTGCVSLSLGVYRFLLYEPPRRLGQVCHNYFPEPFSMHCREWTEIRYDKEAVANTAVVHKRPPTVAEILDSFDNETTLANKVAALLRESTGVCLALYHVELDDERGFCESQTPYSRLRAVTSAMRLRSSRTRAPPRNKRKP